MPSTLKPMGAIRRIWFIKMACCTCRKHLPTPQMSCCCSSSRPASAKAAVDLCHHDTGHQGRDRTYSLLKERFWWPKMRTQMMASIMNCAKCKMFEKREPKATVVFHCGDRANGSDSCGPVRLGNNDGSTYSTGSTESFGNNRPLLQYVQAYKVPDK